MMNQPLTWKSRLHEIIFEADTPEGKAFDVILMIAILLSVAAVMLESVTPIRQEYGTLLRLAEWVFTLLFTLEYSLRIACIKAPRSYIFSFFGIIDLLAIVPTYLSLFIPGAQSLVVIRTLRLLRVFRVLKLGRYVIEERALRLALAASRPKITVFLVAILSIVTIMGTLMYLIEGEAGGFSSIPRGIYWAVVTMTTVGYGDITPQTPLGQSLSACLMVIGYGMIAVPTGIISVDLARAHLQVSTQACPNCSSEGHEPDSVFCRRCSARL